MKTVSDDLLVVTGSDSPTTATCLMILRKDGTAFTYTSFDQPLFFDIYAERLIRGANAPSWMNVGRQLYRSNPGYADQDLKTGSDMSTDTTNVIGPMNSLLTDEAITEEDCQAGLFDSARWCVFLVNWNDLTMGSLPLHTGKLGRISTQTPRSSYTAELNGLLQALQTTFGRFMTPACAWTLGDANCRFDIASLQVSGTIAGISDDFLTFYDPARTEVGPVGGTTVTGVSNANPGQVTVADGSILSNGMAVVIAGVVGPSLINNTTVVENLSGNTFDLPIDTSDTTEYPSYVSGGTVTPLGVNASYFGNGVLTWTSGLNMGLSMEIKTSDVGQFTLELEMPYAVAIGDTYTMLPGCDKTIVTCDVKFSNSARHGGFPYMIGVNKLMQAIGS